MRQVVLTALMAMMAAVGCKDAPPPEVKAPEAKAPAAAPDQGSATLVLLRTTGLPMKAVSKKLTHGQLQHAKAQDAEQFLVDKPALKVFVFGYQDGQTAAGAIQDLIGWINNSGLVHNGEAMANGRRILVVGPPTSTPPDDAGRAAVNNLMDTFTATPAP